MPETPEEMAKELAEAAKPHEAPTPKDSVMPGLAGGSVGSAASYDTAGRISAAEAHVLKLEDKIKTLEVFVEGLEHRLAAVESVVHAPDEGGAKEGVKNA